MRRYVCQNTLAVMLVLGAVSCAPGASVELDFVVKGALSAQGLNNEAFNAGPGNTNIGRGGTLPQRRAYFVFDLSSIDTEVVSARLETETPPRSFNSPDPSETLVMYDYDLDIAILQDQQSISVPAYEDLGSGEVYGSRVVSDADEDTTVIFSLNDAAVSGLNNAPRSLFAIGMAMTTVDRPGNRDNSETFFGFTNNSDGARLVLQLVPEPSASLVAALACLSASRVRRPRT